MLKSTARPCAAWLLLTAAVALSGCKGQREAGEPRPGPARASGRASSAAAPGKIAFKDGAGALLCKLEPRGADYKLRDGAGNALGKVKVKAGAEANKVTLKGPDGETLLKIKQKAGHVSVKDGQGAKLYKIKLDGGKWKLKRADGQTLYKIKPRDYGFKVRDAAGATVAKVKRKGGRLVFKSESGEALFRLEGISDPRAGVWFAADKLGLAERAALSVFFLRIYR